jgi:hypothetical protein
MDSGQPLPPLSSTHREGVPDRRRQARPTLARCAFHFRLDGAQGAGSGRRSRPRRRAVPTASVRRPRREGAAVISQRTRLRSSQKQRGRRSPGQPALTTPEHTKSGDNESAQRQAAARAIRTMRRHESLRSASRAGPRSTISTAGERRRKAAVKPRSPLLWRPAGLSSPWRPSCSLRRRRRRNGRVRAR